MFGVLSLREFHEKGTCPNSSQHLEFLAPLPLCLYRLRRVVNQIERKESVHSMPRLAVSFPSWWNSNEQQMPQSLCKSISLTVESTPKLFHNGKHLGLQLPHQESSSAQSIGQSHNEMGAMAGSNSQDQCISSDSGQDESFGKGVHGRMKPDFLMRNSEIIFNQPHSDYNHSMAHTSYPYGDRYFSGLFSPYGPQALIHPQIGGHLVRIAPARVPLLLDPAEDGPIYVNPKQYHGIMRRRKSRAKLEAQNRLAKTRKPYLHESRHLHALNRVRGSGGRFLSTKKPQQHDRRTTSSSNDLLDSTHLYQKNNRLSELESCSGNAEFVASTTSKDIAIVCNSDVIFRQPDCGFCDVSVHMHNDGRHVHGEMHHCASVFR